MTLENPSSISQVLIVDDEISFRRVLTVILEQESIPCKSAPSGEEALKLLGSEPFDAVIADLQMTGMSGMELLARIRQHFPHVAFLMVTGVDDVRVGVQAMHKGADDYLVKPLQLDAVLVGLERALQKKRLETEVENYRRHLEDIVAERTQQLKTALAQLEDSYDATLEALGEAIDLRDLETGGHSRRVALYSTTILTAMGGTEQQLRNITMGAWLHDIGKLGIPDRILLKPGVLTDQERAIMQRHVLIGYDLVKRIPFLDAAAEIVLTHHERFDGTGYPRGLKAEDIPLGARIFAVADTVDAMTSDRPYRSALPFHEARKEIQGGSGSKYDSRVADVFLSIPNETWEALRTEATVKGSTDS